VGLSIWSREVSCAPVAAARLNLTSVQEAFADHHRPGSLQAIADEVQQLADALVHDDLGAAHSVDARAVSVREDRFFEVRDVVSVDHNGDVVIFADHATQVGDRDCPWQPARRQSGSNSVPCSADDDLALVSFSYRLAKSGPSTSF
jgi:hypothetical protein